MSEQIKAVKAALVFYHAPGHVQTQMLWALNRRGWPANYRKAFVRMWRGW